MAHFKLTYFNYRARGELARVILHYAQVPFEDYRIERAEWPTHKPKIPLFGQLPIFEEDGKVLAQSHTICRYLARKHGLVGKNEWEAAQADMYVDCVYDLMGALFKARVAETDVQKKNNEVFFKVNTESFQPHLATIEQHLMKNESGFLVGSSLTWADLAYYTFFAPWVERHGEALILPNLTHLKKLFNNIDSIPQIKNYVQSRPNADI